MLFCKLKIAVFLDDFSARGINKLHVVMLIYWIVVLCVFSVG